MFLNALSLSSLLHAPIQRHVTRMKILNWSKTLRFPSRPSVSFEGVDLMKQLLCEPEDRLGSGSLQSANPALPRHTAARGFAASKGGSADGSELIKVPRLVAVISHNNDLQHHPGGSPVFLQYRLGKYPQITCTISPRASRSRGHPLFFTRYSCRG